MATEIPPVYRFSLRDRTVSATRVTQPVWKDDLALDYEREQGQMFFRTKMSGKLVFVGADAEWIISRGYSHEIGVIVEKADGTSITTVWTGHFYMTDCEVSLDDNRVTVQPTVDDDYNKILAGMDKEFNLVELLPEIEYVRIRKYPLIQVYYPGESTLSCIFGGLTWEQDVEEETSEETLVKDFHFSKNSNLRELTIRINGSVFGVYQADVNITDITQSYQVNYMPVQGGTGTYVFFKYTVSIDPHPDYDIQYYQMLVELRDSSDDSALYRYYDTGIGVWDTSNIGFEMSQVGGSYTAQGQVFSRAIFSRVLLDVDTFDGYETAPLSPSDFCHDNRNYSRAIGWVLGSRYYMLSGQTQVSPTEWGKASNGQYFVEPTSTNDLYPIARTTWDNTSVWIVDDDNIMGFIRNQGTKSFVLRTAYPLASVLNVLLGQIDNGVSHAASTAYSEFLYATTNPVSNQPNRTVMMTPKSNLLAGEFSQPAAKAPVTLKAVLEMLRDVYDCYWHVENGKLRIEHISWYKNGGSYNGSPSVGVDLTAMAVARNNMSWAYGTSAYKYDKSQMPQTFQFGWMDEVTEAFMGKPIDVLSPYVDEGNIEETRVAQFTSDIDYLLLNPSVISKDGFALMAAQYVGGVYWLTETVIAKGTYAWVTKRLVLQNAELAFCLLQPRYLCYDMPARSIRLNGGTATADGVRRTKRQEVRIPYYGEPDPEELVTTYIGDGYVEKMSLSLSSRVAKTVLKYEPE